MLNVFNLQPFAANSSPQIAIAGEITRSYNLLRLNYVVTGDISAIALPNTALSPTRRDGLWEHTCFEFFLGTNNTPQYWEFNLSPDGNWNIYRFNNYRQGMQPEIAIDPLPFKFSSNEKNLRLDLQLNLQPLVSPTTDLQVGITAVIKDSCDRISYWALTHPGEAADFHNRDSFTFCL